MLNIGKDTYNKLYCTVQCQFVNDIHTSQVMVNDIHERPANDCESPLNHCTIRSAEGTIGS